MARRKGSILDSFSIMGGVFIVGIAFILSLFIVLEMQSAAPAILPTFGFKDATAALGLMDTGVVFLVAAFYISSWILALQIPTSPIFFVPAFIINGVALLVSAIFSNVFVDFAESTSLLSSAVNQFPVMYGVFEFLPLVIGVLNTVLLIVTFTSPTVGSGRATV